MNAATAESLGGKLPPRDIKDLRNVSPGLRWRLHAIAAVAVLFLSFYSRLVCPFIDSLDLGRLLAGLGGICLFQIALREGLYRAFPSAWGNLSAARHGMLLAVISWLMAGLAAMGLHMSLYPDFPLASHIKLLTGYWALGAGILTQLELIALERHFRRLMKSGAQASHASERITRRLLEILVVFTLVPAIVLLLTIFRFVYEGAAGLEDALEVGFVVAIFTGAALFVAWRYGIALREDCDAIRQVVADVSGGRFDVKLDSTRPDELGLVARSINDMGRGLVRRGEREAALLEITSSLSEDLHLDSLLQRITHGASTLLAAERATLYLHDPKRGVLWSRVAEGMTARDIELAPDKGLAGACFTSGEVIDIADVSKDPRFDTEMDRRSGFHTRNMLCLPIFNKAGDCFGVIQVLNKRQGVFNPFDIRRLHALGAQAAIALENAQMFEDILNMKNYDEAILKSLSNAVVTLDGDLQLQKINAAAERILGWRAEESLGRPVTELLGAENAWMTKIFRRVAKTGLRDDADDIDIGGAEGRGVSVNMTTVPLTTIGDEDIGVLTVFEDISAEKRVRGTMARYMPKQVVDQVLGDHREVLEGTAQTVSILFTDIRGFTSISEAIGARATVAMLNQYFTEMVEIIDQNEGILDKYIGDAIMAAFGVPFTHADDADNAVAAANGMMHALESLNRRRLEAGEKPLKHGIGINTGEAIAGNIGSPKRMDYTVIGDAVNLAARLESLSKYYGVPIIISEFTKRLLKSPGHLREIDLLRVKGKAQPVKIFESFDFLADDLSDRQRHARALQGDVLALYRRQDWADAARLFEAAAEADPSDLIPRFYLERIAHFRENPPPDDWDGVWTMTAK